MSEVTNKVSKTLSAAGQETEVLEAHADVRYYAYSNSFVGTVTVQAKFYESDDFVDVGTITGNFFDFDEVPGTSFFKMIIKPGDYTSGSIDVSMDGGLA